MIHSVRPSVAISEYCFLLFCFLDLKSGDGRRDGRTDNMCKNNDLYRPWLWVGRVDQNRKFLLKHKCEAILCGFELKGTPRRLEFGIGWRTDPYITAIINSFIILSIMSRVRISFIFFLACSNTIGFCGPINFSPFFFLCFRFQSSKIEIVHSCMWTAYLGVQFPIFDRLEVFRQYIVNLSKSRNTVYSQLSI